MWCAHPWFVQARLARIRGGQARTDDSESRGSRVTTADPDWGRLDRFQELAVSLGSSGHDDFDLPSG
jgi:hypothetical protein